MIHAIATIELNPGCRDAFLAEFHALVPEVRAEAGCLAYGPTVDLPADLRAQPPARPDVVTIVEQWEGLDHLKAHLTAPHMAAYRLRVRDFVKQTTLHVLAPA